MSETVDIFVIGGGVNGVGIARDAAGRGLRVTLAEMGDLAQATSSASSKLIHGGLRYLEFYEFRLVRESLQEREKLLAAMPHIAWPMRFVLPHHSGLRPDWMLRSGLFLYDRLGGRGLPGTKRINLRSHPAGALLKPDFRTGFEYSDAWVDDARLVALNARDSEMRGARIMTRAKVVATARHASHWEVNVERDGRIETHRARKLVNAAGPWAGDLSEKTGDSHKIRLVRGSHIVIPRLPGHNQPYILQGGDGRIVFVIPYEDDFTLIGTTEAEHHGDPKAAECSPEEAAYLVDFVNDYLATPVSTDDVVWTYSGVRPLIETEGSARSASRDYQLAYDDSAAPLLTVLGGKLTTFRKLSEAALEKLGYSGQWTARAPLPGGTFDRQQSVAMVGRWMERHPFLTEAWARRLLRAYGTEAETILGASQTVEDLGQDFGATLTEAEVRHLMRHEFARTAEDVLWRRSKLGLRMDAAGIEALESFMAGRRDEIRAAE
ncbi:glycerol-3-phosphate dehydrogenase [Maritimibacter sp. UBA3975]|uniref:glycerol-3-phosphate dehydrogenase n=1 Tax=Maritimibacter sp. UBA3975 TaxID=1946833 RepID=UPI000C09F8EE|nr:glycerol-3-phosphate dehydrogenase [Maritimibacter sp. UBA3975]MAM60795.1 glycerol-3-phosphate dehydrogenase [Maritimibacter sp.]|tara:strand:- start:2143 stop:3618 length:1476 start_codon:yes stop_codon:yes gene_type:complete